MLDFFINKKRFHQPTWINQVLSSPYHQWIKENKFLNHNLRYLLGKIPSVNAEQLSKQGELLFITSSGRWAASYVHQGVAILIYPEVEKLLHRTNPGIALAILAHEIGHLIHKHHQKIIDPIQAQIEADDFAFKIGFGEELSEFLESCPKTEEVAIRLTYLTAKVITKQFS